MRTPHAIAFYRTCQGLQSLSVLERIWLHLDAELFSFYLTRACIRKTATPVKLLFDLNLQLQFWHTMSTPLEAVAQSLQSHRVVSNLPETSTMLRADAQSIANSLNGPQNVKAPGTAAKLSGSTGPSVNADTRPGPGSGRAEVSVPVSSPSALTPPLPSSSRSGLLSLIDEGVLRFLVGGLAGATAKTIIAPLDRMKIIFQISHKVFSFKGVWAELVSTARSEGLPGLFRGNAAQILRVYPYSGIQLMAFDTYTALLLKEKQAVARLAGQEPPVARSGRTASSQLSPIERMLAGSAAGATSVAATYPLDCIRARLAVQQELKGEAGTVRYRGIWHAMRLMAGEQGVGSLYRGMAPTLLGILPYAGISFATYETLKATAALEGEVPNWKRLMFGGLAGLAGQVSARTHTRTYAPQAHSPAPLSLSLSSPCAGYDVPLGYSAAAHADRWVYTHPRPCPARCCLPSALP